MTERVTSLLQRIPGYSGYQDKESRRDEDKRLRTATADRLTDVIDQLTAFNAAQVAKRNFSGVTSVEQIISKTRLLGDRIRTASYGYGGLFSDRPIDGPALDQLRQFDLSIQNRVEKIAAGTGANITASDGLEGISTEIDSISTLFNARGAVIETAQPAKEKAVLDLLGTSQPPTPSPLLKVSMGDAFSVLGDDFQAKATVALIDGDLSIKLIRIGETDGTDSIWYVGASSPNVPSARLVEKQEGGCTPEPTMRTAVATVESERGKQDRVAAGYAVVPQPAGDAVAFMLTISGTRRYFIGTPIHDLDVEIYGSGKN